MPASTDTLNPPAPSSVTVCVHRCVVLHGHRRAGFHRRRVEGEAGVDRDLAVLEPRRRGRELLLLLPQAARPTARRGEGDEGEEASLHARNTAAEGPRGSVLLAGQAERALADDVALDLVGAGPDRAGLVVEPRALPRAVAGVVAPRRARAAARARAPPSRCRAGACSSRSTRAC